jgi:hypothetical protein
VMMNLWYYLCEEKVLSQIVRKGDNAYNAL